MNVGIVGASGYSGEVLVKLLLGHPQVKLTAVTSRQHAGKIVSQVIPALRGSGAEQLRFSESDPVMVAARKEIGLWFLALPHGTAADFAQTLVPAGRKVIDLSADFRIADLATYEKYYGTHHAPALLPQARFILPELTDPRWIKEIKLAAAPGCYPTSTILPLAPLLSAHVVANEHIVVNSFSGVSGAGKKIEEQYLYAERAESAQAYGLTKHRHLAEIEEQLSLAAAAQVVVQFNPHLAPMRRGIITTTTIPAAKGATIDTLYAAWRSAYAGKPFISILPSGQTPDSAHVAGTNRLDLSAVHDERTGNFILTSAVDNLVKGASGQAIQIMNLWLGLPETAGLL